MSLDMSSFGSITILNLFCKLLFRLIFLFFNGLIVRSIDLNLIGLANIRLELISTTILFFSRESLRRTIPKLTNLHSFYHYINLIWLILPLGLILIFFSFVLTLFVETNDPDKLVPFYSEACFMYGLAAFIELLSEPFYLLSILTNNSYINIYIEFFASVIGKYIRYLYIKINSFV
jgi:hypothetical protein